MYPPEVIKLAAQAMKNRKNIKVPDAPNPSPTAHPASGDSLYNRNPYKLSPGGQGVIRGTEVVRNFLGKSSSIKYQPAVIKAAAQTILEKRAFMNQLSQMLQQGVGQAAPQTPALSSAAQQAIGQARQNNFMNTSIPGAGTIGAMRNRANAPAPAAPQGGGNSGAQTRLQAGMQDDRIMSQIR